MKHDPQGHDLKGSLASLSPDGPQHSHFLIYPLSALPSSHCFPPRCSHACSHFPDVCTHSCVSESVWGKPTVSVSSGCCNKNHDLEAENGRSLSSHSSGELAVSNSGHCYRDTGRATLPPDPFGGSVPTSPSSWGLQAFPGFPCFHPHVPSPLCLCCISLCLCLIRTLVMPRKPTPIIQANLT